MIEKYSVLLSYDLNEEHDKVKKELLKQGYHESVLIDDKKYYLPNTTVWKKDFKSDLAIADIVGICKSLDVKLNRCVATKFSNVKAIVGISYKN